MQNRFANHHWRHNGSFQLFSALSICKRFFRNGTVFLLMLTKLSLCQRKLKQEQKSSAIDCLSLNLLFRAVRFPIKTQVQTHNFALKRGCLCSASFKCFIASSIHWHLRTNSNTSPWKYSQMWLQYAYLSPRACVCVGVRQTISLVWIWFQSLTHTDRKIMLRFSR